jgi:putative solute:sodium symporter small subunit
MVQPIPRIGLTLAILVVAAFFGFIILAAISPATLAQPTIGAVPLSFVLTAGLILGTILVTGIYVWTMNAAESRR